MMLLFSFCRPVTKYWIIVLVDVSPTDGDVSVLILVTLFSLKKIKTTYMS